MRASVAADVEKSDEQPEGGDDSGRAPRTRRWLLVAAVVAVLAAGAAAFAIVGQGSASPDTTPESAATGPADVTAGAPTADDDDAGTAAGDDVTADGPSGAEARTGGGTDGAAAPEAEGSADDPLLGPDPALPPVALDAAAEFGDGIAARLVGVESVTAQAQGPGEIAGPAVRVTVVLANEAAEPVPVGNVVVNVYAGEEHAPGEPMTGSEAEPFTGRIEPGDEQAGVYVFRVSDDVEGQLHVTVSHDPSTPTAVFTGSLPGAG